jgi:hypothetical protein
MLETRESSSVACSLARVLAFAAVCWRGEVVQRHYCTLTPGPLVSLYYS